MSTKYLSCAETAKLVRKQLAAKFPGVKFSVVSKTYSGGASIRVTYMDGPNIHAVKQVAEHFEGATFDSMQDMKLHPNQSEDGVTCLLLQFSLL